MSHAAAAFACFATVRAAADEPRRKPNSKKQKKNEKPKNSNGSSASFSNSSRSLGFGSKRKDPEWQCVPNCGACCKLDKGPSFASPEEIFDDPSDVELYKRLIGPDGWCINFEKSTRKCSIYADRPYFCRVEPGIFEMLYGIEHKKFNKEACSCCIDSIKAIYGSNSRELETFNHTIWSSNSED